MANKARNEPLEFVSAPPEYTSTRLSSAQEQKFKRKAILAASVVPKVRLTYYAHSGPTDPAVLAVLKHR